MYSKTETNKPFSAHAINTGRQFELDIARGLAVVFMVLVHVQMTFANYTESDSTLANVIDFMGGIPAAPVFMFLMGVGFVYSRKTDYKKLLKRGLYIFLAGYMLNFLRDSLPELVDYFSKGRTHSLHAAIEGFIDIDILQFAGLSMIFFGSLKRIKATTTQIVIAGIVLSLLPFLLADVQVETYFGAASTGLLWGSSEYSEFPFLNWVFYPVAGYTFARWLIRCTNKPLFYSQLFLISSILILLLATMFLEIPGEDLGMGNEIAYYHHSFFANIIYTLFTLSWLSFLFGLTNLLPAKLLAPFKRWSRNVTKIYFIHWVLIGWLAWYVYPDTFGIAGFWIISVCIFFISDAIAHVLQQKQIRFL